MTRRPVFASPVSMIEVGLKAPLHIREERVSRHPASRVLYISDIHLRRRRSEAISRQVLDAVIRCAPDLVLLGGDLVDGSTELPALSDLVEDMCETAPVLAVGGNHDYRVGMSRVADAVMSGGGRWIHDRGARITHGDRVITVAGPATTAPMSGDVRILCAHNPNIWKSSRDAGYDLVLAGHLDDAVALQRGRPQVAAEGEFGVVLALHEEVSRNAEQARC